MVEQKVDAWVHSAVFLTFLKVAKRPNGREKSGWVGAVGRSAEWLLIETALLKSRVFENQRMSYFIVFRHGLYMYIQPWSGQTSYPPKGENLWGGRGGMGVGLFLIEGVQRNVALLLPR